DDVALWDEVVSAQTVALTHGLGKFMGTVVNDPAIDAVRGVFDAGPGSWAVVGDRTWAYATAAELVSPATLGATGGQASRNAYIALDAAGNGVQVVNSELFTSVGAGTGIAHTSVDTVGTGPRTNVDRGSSLLLGPGSYEAVDFSFAYGQSGAAIPFLARWISEGEYEIIAVGDTQTVTGVGTLTVDFGDESRFVLDEPTRILAGFTGVNGFDNPVSYQNGTPTGTSHRSGAVSAVVGQTVSGFGYLNLGRTYAFSITVVPEPSSVVLILVALLGLLATRGRRR
ncbi:MAG: PEP-CTERM sorting domain-containing protein, partial [Patescibacteria group bacterium]|nr:PEP-CTERM sorting domain-containing protein [Patescibacteria group bacterium]